MANKKQGFLAIVRREILRMQSRPLYGLSMIFAPLFCFVFFTSLMHEGLPQSLPAGVVDEDNTTVSRSILRNLDSYQQTEIIKQYSSFAEAREAMQRNEIYGFFYIPKGTGAKASSQQQPVISIYTNAAYLIPSSLLYRDMKTMAVMASAAVGREVLFAKGANMDQAMGFLQPIQMYMHPIGNPWLNYNVYLSNTMLPVPTDHVVLTDGTHLSGAYIRISAIPGTQRILAHVSGSRTAHPGIAGICGVHCIGHTLTALVTEPVHPVGRALHTYQRILIPGNGYAGRAPGHVIPVPAALLFPHLCGSGAQRNPHGLFGLVLYCPHGVSHIAALGHKPAAQGGSRIYLSTLKTRLYVDKRYAGVLYCGAAAVPSAVRLSVRPRDGS